MKEGGTQELLTVYEKNLTKQTQIAIKTKVKTLGNLVCGLKEGQ